MANMPRIAASDCKKPASCCPALLAAFPCVFFFEPEAAVFFFFVLLPANPKASYLTLINHVTKIFQKQYTKKNGKMQLKLPEGRHSPPIPHDSPVPFSHDRAVALSYISNGASCAHE